MLLSFLTELTTSGNATKVKVFITLVERETSEIIIIATTAAGFTHAVFLMSLCDVITSVNLPRRHTSPRAKKDLILTDVFMKGLISLSSAAASLSLAEL